MAGPGGEVGLGDSLDLAKKAFPAAKGAQMFDAPMSFGLVSKEGWAWASEAENKAFEVATKEGKIIALADTSATPIDGVLKQTTDRIGEPTRKAEGTTGSMYVWEWGENARFLLLIKQPLAMMPFTKLDIIGKKDDLKMLNYRADDPENFVKQLDAASAQMNSPEMKKAFEDAKKKASQKG
jgi:hypothetical protein